MTNQRTRTNSRRLFITLKMVSKKLVQFRADKKATSAVEFSFFVGMLSLALVNVVDVSNYVYQRMEANNATEMAAQAALKACNINSLPATKNCSGLMSAVTAAVQSTSLGKKVALQSGYPAEGYYCVNSGGALQYVGGIGAEPADCTAAGMPNLQPHDYLEIKTTFAYQPILSGLSVTGLLTTPITSTSWMRLD